MTYPADRSTWKPNLMAYNKSNLDLGYYENEMPAGQHGFLQRVGDHFEFENSPGVEVKLWGTNLQHKGIFLTDDQEIIDAAVRMKNLGIEIVRIMAIDAVWSRNNIFDIVNYRSAAGSRPPYDTESLRKLDLWISELKKNGIYVCLPLFTTRGISSADVNDAAFFDEMLSTYDFYPVPKAKIAHYNFINQTLIDLMIEFQEEIMNRTNQYTGLAYKNDPVIAMVQTNNENDITNIARDIFYEKEDGVLLNPEHNAIWLSLADDFQAANPSFALADIKNVLNKSEGRKFHLDLEYKQKKQLFDNLTNDIGYQGVKIGSVCWQARGYPVWGYHSHDGGDCIDTHTYMERTLQLDMSDPSPAIDSGLPTDNQNAISKCALPAVVDKPLICTEWNRGASMSEDRMHTFCNTAAIAALQDWDAMFHFGYVNLELIPDRKANAWMGYIDVAQMALMPAAGLIFKHVSKALNSYTLSISENDAFNVEIRQNNALTVRTLVETSLIRTQLPETAALPWFNQPPVLPGSTVTADWNHNYFSEGQTSVTSDTGEIFRDWGNELHTINTDKSKLIEGKLNGVTKSITGLEVTSSIEYAIVCINSLDDLDLDVSNKILITLMARVYPAVNDGDPYESEPVIGTIKIKAKAGLILKSVLDDSVLTVPTSVYSYVVDEYIINMDADNFTSHLYYLENDTPANNPVLQDNIFDLVGIDNTVEKDGFLIGSTHGFIDGPSNVFIDVQPTKGTLSEVWASGHFRYIYTDPVENLPTTDSFDVHVIDENGTSNTVTQTLNITAESIDNTVGIRIHG